MRVGSDEILFNYEKVMVGAKNKGRIILLLELFQDFLKDENGPRGLWGLMID